MSALAILKDFISRCKSVFENRTTKMSKRYLNWLILTTRTVVLIPGKENSTRLSLYGRRSASTFIYENPKGANTECHTDVVHLRAMKRDIPIYGKSTHIKIIQQTNNPLAQLAA